MCFLYKHVTLERIWYVTVHAAGLAYFDQYNSDSVSNCNVLRVRCAFLPFIYNIIYITIELFMSTKTKKQNGGGRWLRFVLASASNWFWPP